MLETVAWIAMGVVLVPAHRMARAQSRGLLAALVTIEAIAAAMIAIAVTTSHGWQSLAREDGVVEWASFVAFVLAAGWLVIVVRRRSPSWWFKGACFALATFCLVVAGEEISWGQRLFGFKPPDVFLERNFQQEANLHNVLMDERGLGFALQSKHLVMAIVLGFCVVWPWLVRRPRFVVFAPLAPSRAFLPLAAGVVAAELGYAVELTGEGAELVVGLIFLGAALTATAHRARTIVAVLVAPLVLGWLISVVLAHVVFASDEDGTRLAEAELALLADDVVAGVTPKLANRRVHKRVFTSARDGYVRLAGGRFLDGEGTPAEPGASPRRDRRGYFLDPWNNPYWVHYNKRTRSGLVYSFGPNRRRDVVVRDAGSDPGDDIVVRFTIGER